MSEEAGIIGKREKRVSKGKTFVFPENFGGIALKITIFTILAIAIRIPR